MTDTTNLGPVIDVLADMRAESVFSDYAIGGAVAGIIHNEPFNTIDLDIFFFFVEQQTGPILSLEKIYDYARDKGFSFDKDFINIMAGPFSLLNQAIISCGLRPLKRPR